MGDAWEGRIEQALASATILIPVIGPSWLKVADEHGRRRLDNEKDWVRNEICHALEAKLHIIPLLLSQTRMPLQEALPPAIATLPRFQGFELRDDRWETDLSILLDRLSGLGLKCLSTRAIRYPTPKVSLKELTEQEVRSALDTLVGWEIVETEIRGREPKRGLEFHRSFEFDSFEDAVAFMAAAVPRISEMDHHPRWENIWRTVSVWLTTWDIGDKPSDLDVKLAKFLSELRDAFPAVKTRKK
jgi:pterin-4a-carbinolamine dehydratase